MDVEKFDFVGDVFVDEIDVFVDVADDKVDVFDVEVVVEAAEVFQAGYSLEVGRGEAGELLSLDRQILDRNWKKKIEKKNILEYCQMNYSQTWLNDHLWTTASLSHQWPV